MTHTLSIMLVNMHRQNNMLHALLQTSTSDIIAIQEPWFGPVRTDRSDSNPVGTQVYGTTHNNLWHCFHPSTGGDMPFKTAIYVKNHVMKACDILL
jgi:hypothetical protein